MNVELKQLKCLSKEEHDSHEWTFSYDNPITPYHCPGLVLTRKDDE